MFFYQDSGDLSSLSTMTMATYYFLPLENGLSYTPFHEDSGHSPFLPLGQWPLFISFHYESSHYSSPSTRAVVIHVSYFHLVYFYGYISYILLGMLLFALFLHHTHFINFYFGNRQPYNLIIRR